MKTTKSNTIVIKVDGSSNSKVLGEFRKLLVKDGWKQVKASDFSVRPWETKWEKNINE